MNHACSIKTAIKPRLSKPSLLYIEMTKLILKDSKMLNFICRSKKYVILFPLAEMSSVRNVRGRNVHGRNVLAETSVAKMSVAEMSEHHIL